MSYIAYYTFNTDPFTYIYLLSLLQELEYHLNKYHQNIYGSKSTVQVT